MFKRITRRKGLLIRLTLALLIIAGVSFGVVELVKIETAPKTIPPFTPVVPRGESQLARLGRKNYDVAHNSYTFFDYYLALPLQVSEQPLPNSDRNVAKTVKAAASAFQADERFATRSNGFAYVTTKPAPTKQIVVFSEKGLLVFLESSFAQNTSFWNGYIDTLIQSRPLEPPH